MDAFHLPALPQPRTAVWTYGAPGADELRLRVAQLKPADLERQVAALVVAGREELQARNTSEIVGAIDQVAGRFLTAGDEVRNAAERVLPRVSGASLEMVRRVLDRMAADWRAPALRAMLRAELGGESFGDGFAARPGGGRARAYGPRLTTHVFSGNVPGVAITSLIRALLVKSPSIGKTAVGEPFLAPLFARALAEVDAALGRSLAVTYWPGGAEELERVALREAEAVVVYGSREAVASVQARSPVGARFLGYGHRLSFAVLAREAMTAEGAPELAQRVALDVATFDQQGCVSPHLVYVEEGGEVEPRAWARQLSVALAALEHELPRGALSPSESAAIRQLRGEAEFAQIAGRGVELHASPSGTAWTVIYDPDPAFAASCLNRVVRVKPVADLDAVPALAAEVGPVLQSVGVAGPEARIVALASALGQIGASRVTSVGIMAWPPPTWHHDGRLPLQDLVRWCDLETPL